MCFIKQAMCATYCALASISLLSGNYQRKNYSMYSKYRARRSEDEKKKEWKRKDDLPQVVPPIQNSSQKGEICFLNQ